MVKRFGEYLLSSPWVAALMALMFSVLPLFGWLSLTIVGLVTLRKGWRAGLWVTLWASMPSIVFGFFGMTQFWIFGILGGTLAVWGMACFLRYSASWTLLLEVSALFAVLLIAALHLLMPDLPAWWIAKYTELLNQVTQGVSSGQAAAPQFDPQVWADFTSVLQQPDLLAKVARVSTGFSLSFLLLSKWMIVGLARWWQAALFNPQGLRVELYFVRIGYTALLGFALTVLAMLVLGWLPAWDIFPIFMLLYLLAGLSLLHALLARTPMAILGLSLLYLLMIFLPFYVIGIVAMLACGDTLIDFRGRIIQPKRP